LALGSGISFRESDTTLREWLPIVIGAEAQEMYVSLTFGLIGPPEEMTFALRALRLDGPNLAIAGNARIALQ
jgi:hypothetical protein